MHGAVPKKGSFDGKILNERRVGRGGRGGGGKATSGKGREFVRYRKKSKKRKVTTPGGRRERKKNLTKVNDYGKK